MANIILCGCYSTLGQTLSKMIEENNDLEIIAGIDTASDETIPDAGYPIYENIGDLSEMEMEAADVIISLSDTSMPDGMLEHCLETGTPLAVYYEESLTDIIKEAYEEIPVFAASHNIPDIIPVIKQMKKAASILKNAGIELPDQIDDAIENAAYSETTLAKLYMNAAEYLARMDDDMAGLYAISDIITGWMDEYLL